MVIHHGATANSGHYTSIVHDKRHNLWIDADDLKVTVVMQSDNN